jgi:hypothetical protein
MIGDQLQITMGDVTGFPCVQAMNFPARGAWGDVMIWCNKYGLKLYSTQVSQEFSGCMMDVRI